jgi:hypothetical protein
VSQECQVSVKDELVITEGVSESSNKLTAEDATEYVDGKKEPIA